MTDTSHPSEELLRHWCALLDGELPQDQANQLWAEVDAHLESKRFIDAQKRFNQSLEAAMSSSIPSRLPLELKLQIQSSFDQADLESAKPGLRLVSDPKSTVSQIRRIGMGWNLAGMAAMLVIGLTIGALAFAPKDPTKSGNSVALQNELPAPQFSPDIVRLETFGGKASELMLNMGAQPDRIQSFAREVGFDAPLPQHPGNEHVKPMVPVNIHSGSIDGFGYLAVTLCTGLQGAKEAPEKPSNFNQCPTRGALQRVVVFIVDGNLKPGCATVDDKKCWKQCMVGHSYLAKWDEAAKKTYLVYVPGTVPEDRMREIAEPLLLSASVSGWPLK